MNEGYNLWFLFSGRKEKVSDGKIKNMSELTEFEGVQQVEGSSSLEILDSLPLIDEEEIPPQFARDVVTELGGEGISLIEEVIASDLGDEIQTDLPPNFETMLDASTGTLAQRLGKMWIKPTNPEGTIRLLEALKVDKFRILELKVAKHVLEVLRARKDRAPQPFQSNYTVADTSLPFLIDFATNQTFLNEKIHLIGLALNLAVILPVVTQGKMDNLVFMNTVTLAINTYCILSQRYTRARLTKAINRALQKNRNFDLKRYKNLLGLKLSVPKRVAE